VYDICDDDLPKEKLFDIWKIEGIEWQLIRLSTFNDFGTVHVMQTWAQRKQWQKRTN
jgi:hypothetical protein